MLLTYGNSINFNHKLSFFKLPDIDKLIEKANVDKQPFSKEQKNISPFLQLYNFNINFADSHKCGLKIFSVIIVIMLYHWY